MPITLISISVLFLFISACFNQDRHISNHSKSLSVVPTSQMSYRGIVQRAIGLKFKVVQSVDSEITAAIELPNEYTGALLYKWTLGEGLGAANTDLSGRIEKYEKNKVLFLKIVVQGFHTDSTKHIRFEISSEKTEKRIFADGIIANNKENSFEDIVRQIEKYKKENAK